MVLTFPGLIFSDIELQLHGKFFMSGFGFDIQKYASVNESICQIFIAKFIWYMYYFFYAIQ